MIKCRRFRSGPKRLVPKYASGYSVVVIGTIINRFQYIFDLWNTAYVLSNDSRKILNFFKAYTDGSSVLFYWKIIVAAVICNTIIIYREKRKPLNRTRNILTNILLYSIEIIMLFDGLAKTATEQVNTVTNVPAYSVVFSHARRTRCIMYEVIM